MTEKFVFLVEKYVMTKCHFVKNVDWVGCLSIRQKSEDLGEVDSEEGFEAGEKVILADGVEGKTGKRGSRHVVTDRGAVREQQAGKTGHGDLHACAQGSSSDTNLKT